MCSLLLTHNVSKRDLGDRELCLQEREALRGQYFSGAEKINYLVLIIEINNKELVGVRRAEQHLEDKPGMRGGTVEILFRNYESYLHFSHVKEPSIRVDAVRVRFFDEICFLIQGLNTVFTKRIY